MSEYGLYSWAANAPLTGVCVERGGRYAAFAGGDGCVRIVDLHEKEPRPTVRPLVEGAILALTTDCGATGFLCGADDGVVYRVEAEAGPHELAALDRAWPDLLVSHPSGLIAVADGPQVRLLDAAGRPCRTLGSHPSSVAGLAFDEQARRLAVSHYDGVSLWTLDGQGDEPRRFSHRGSHLSLRWSKNGRYLVTATQEKTLHAWDLETGCDASLGPSFKKTKAHCWSADSTWLLASGSDTVSAWSFQNGGLPAAAPQMLGRHSEHLIGHVCAHPALPLAAVGYNDGGLELVSMATRPQRQCLADETGSPIAGLAWSPEGDHLLGGDSDGGLFAYRLDLERLALLARAQDAG